MKNRPLVGVAVIVIKNGKVLLGKRKGSHGSGYWAFPGGHLEMNESIEACARREVFEETGIVPHSERLEYRWGLSKNDALFNQWQVTSTG